MEYSGGSPQVKRMREMEPSREIVLSEMTPLEFYNGIGKSKNLRAATVQIVGTKPLVPCRNCEILPGHSQNV